MPRRNLNWMIVIATISLICWRSVQSAPEEHYRNFFELFAETLQHIDSSHIRPPERKELLEGALRGITKRLDRFSDYIPPRELQRFREQMSQEFGGIGIQIGVIDSQLTVTTPLPGTPAFRAGVQSGDRIVAIEGEPTKDILVGSPQEMMQEAVRRLKGAPGTTVNISVLHKGSEMPEEVDITRAIIQVSSVKGDRYNKDSSWDFLIEQDQQIGYLRIEQFNDKPANELENAIQTLNKQSIKGLILDLRFNPGGLLSAAVKICDLFISEGKIVSTRSRNAEEVVYSAHGPGTFNKEMPIVVLINRHSASASEIVAACLQDHQRAVLIGQRTWGKGSVQNIIDLGSGQGAIKLTTASYHRPSGENIHRFENSTETDVWGVRPNQGFEISMIETSVREGKSTAEIRQLEAQASSQYFLDRSNRDIIPRPGEPSPKRSFKDYQLDRAVEHLKSKIHPEKDDSSAFIMPLKNQMSELLFTMSGNTRTDIRW